MIFLTSWVKSWHILAIFYKLFLALLCVIHHLQCGFRINLFDGSSFTLLFILHLIVYFTSLLLYCLEVRRTLLLTACLRLTSRYRGQLFRTLHEGIFSRRLHDRKIFGQHFGSNINWAYALIISRYENGLLRNAKLLRCGVSYPRWDGILRQQILFHLFSRCRVFLENVYVFDFIAPTAVYNSLRQPFQLL